MAARLGKNIFLHQPLISPWRSFVFFPDDGSQSFLHCGSLSGPLFPPAVDSSAHPLFFTLSLSLSLLSSLSRLVEGIAKKIGKTLGLSFEDRVEPGVENAKNPSSHPEIVKKEKTECLAIAFSALYLDKSRPE